MEKEDQVITCHDNSEDAAPAKKIPVLALNGTAKNLENLENQQASLSKEPKTTPNRVTAQGQDEVVSQFQCEGVVSPIKDVAFSLESTDALQEPHSPDLDEENIDDGIVQHEANSGDSNFTDDDDDDAAGGGSNTKRGDTKLGENSKIMADAPSDCVVKMTHVTNSVTSEIDARLSADLTEGVCHSTIKSVTSEIDTTADSVPTGHSTINSITSEIDNSQDSVPTEGVCHSTINSITSEIDNSQDSVPTEVVGHSTTKSVTSEIDNSQDSSQSTIKSVTSEIDTSLAADSVPTEGVSHSIIKSDETCEIPIAKTVVGNLAGTEEISETSFVNKLDLHNSEGDSDVEQFSEIVLDSDLSISENENGEGDGEEDPTTTNTMKKKRVRFADEVAGDNGVGHSQRSPPPPPSSVPEIPSPSRTSRHPGVPITPSPTSPKHKVPVHQFSLDELINGVEMSAEYLGSTPIILEGTGTIKSARMYQAQQAVQLIKDPENESRPRFAVKVKISTSAIILADQVTDTDLMSHPLHTITYVADIDSVLVIMAHIQPMAINPPPVGPNSGCPDPDLPPDGQEGEVAAERSTYVPKLTCHVLDAANARNVAMVIGQAFSAAYKQSLKANGVKDELLDQAEYAHILNAQSVPKIEVETLSDRSKTKKLTIAKHKNDIMGMMVMESGYGSAIPASVIMTLSKMGVARKSGLLNVGDHILSINGVNLVGMPRKICIEQIKKCRYMNVVKMEVCSCPAVVDITIVRPDLKFQLGFSIHEGMICSLMRGSIAERSGVRVGHRIIEINGTSTVGMHHAEIVHLLSSTVGDLHIRTMSDVMYKLLTGKLQPEYC